MPTPAQVIDINNVSGYLAANEVSKGILFSPYNDPKLPSMLYLEGKALIWGNQYGASGLQGVANYVYALDGAFGLTATAIISGGGGGSVSPVTPPTGNAPEPIYLTISPVSSPFSSVISSATLTSFIGYNLVVTRGGFTQYPINNGGTYYSWNRITGLFQWFPNLLDEDEISITATI